MARFYPTLVFVLCCSFWTADAMARGRGYSNGGGGFGLGVILIGAIGYGIYKLSHLFSGLGEILGGLVVIFAVSNFVAIVLEELGVVESAAVTTFVLPVIAGGVYLVYDRIK